MRLLTLKDVLEREPGEIIPGFVAQVKQVHDQKSGTNQFGLWTMQTLTLMDSTAICPVKLFDAPLYDAQWVGIHVQFESTPDEHGKLRGIQIASYRDKKEVQVKAKAGATIAQATEDAPADPEPPAPAKPVPTKVAPVKAGPPAPVQAAIAQSAPSPVKVAPVPVPGPKKSVAEAGQEVRSALANAKGRLGQQCNALIMAYDAAIYVGTKVMEKHPDIPAMFPPDVLEKIAVSFVIELSRSGLVLGLPAGPLDAWTAKPKAVEPPPPEPEPEQTAEQDDVAF